MPKIDPHPWQTDTSIGDWYYNRDWKFRPVSWVIHMLVDNVSKNGNLLLNVVQRPDGSLDPEVEQMLEQLAAWIALHGEAIYETRPWLVYGESAVKVKGGHFGEDFKYNAREIRFTTKGATLYAIALGWPEDGQLVVKSLAKPAGENVNNLTAVSLLGSDAKLDWKQTPEALLVTLPAQKVSEHAIALKIAGTELKNISFTVPVPAIRPDAQGVLTLGAADAELHGDGIKQEEKGGKPNIGFWDRGDEWVSWKAQFPQAGAYQASALCATVHAESEVVLEVAGQRLVGKVTQTGGWDAFRPLDLGRIEVKEAGDQAVSVRPRDAAAWKAINLASVTLKPVK
jgi:alpha-L-fucosidase